jgi:outer membrane autotransporter protein
MKRLFVSAAILPLLHAGVAHAETKISTATTAPVRTSTAANGQPDHLVVDAGGSIAPTAPGAAVTVDSSNAVANNGTISFTGVNGATGIQIQPGVFTAVSSSGSINLVEDYTATDADSDGDVDGAFAQGSNRFGIRAVPGGAGVVNGAINNAGGISVEGNDSGGISIETRLNGTLTQSGTVTVVGDRGVGVRADSVSGDVNIRGAVGVQGEGSVGVQVGSIDGGLLLQGTVTATGYRSTERLSDAARAKLDADDLKQGGSAVRITGSIGKGVLLDRAPLERDSNDTDEDDDGIADTSEGTGSATSFGAAPAIDIGGTTPLTLGAVGSGDYGFGIVNRGNIGASGVNDGIGGTALRIGPGVTVQGGLHNWGGSLISSQAFGAPSTAVLVNAGASLPYLRNGGTISAGQSGGLHDARAIVDLSGTLGLVENSGDIGATITSPSSVTQTGRAVAIDLSANTSGAIVRQRIFDSADTPTIVGDVLFGSGADRLELTVGSLAGTMNFGAGADVLSITGGATATGAVADSDGRLAISIADGRLSVTNSQPLTLTSLDIGAKGVLAVTIDPGATSARFNVNGAASLATGAQLDVTLSGISRGSQSYQIIQAQSLTAGQAGATLAGAPYLYVAALRTSSAAGQVFVDIRPKTAAELGLNRSGAQAYDAVFASLDKDNAIEQAFLSQTTQAGFDELYDQMLPDHSGGVLMSAAAISAAVSSAVAQPMRIDEASGRGVWAQEVAFNMKNDRADAMGYKSQGFGFAAGMDLQGYKNALGANVSFVSADVKDRGAASDEEVTMSLLGVGLYWRYDGGPLQVAVRGGGGYAFLKGDRRLVSEDLNLRTKADWNAWMIDGYAGASYQVRAGSLYLRPEASLSYIRLAEDGYQEKGGGAGFDLKVDSRTGDLLAAEALLALGWRFGDEVYIAPEIKAGYRAKLAGGPPKTTAHFEGGQDFTLSPEDAFKGGVIGRLGFRGGAARVLYAVNGGVTMDDDYEEYDVRATVRFQF